MLARSFGYGSRRRMRTVRGGRDAREPDARRKCGVATGGGQGQRNLQRRGATGSHSRRRCRHLVRGSHRTSVGDSSARGGPCYLSPRRRPRTRRGDGVTRDDGGASIRRRHVFARHIADSTCNVLSAGRCVTHRDFALASEGSRLDSRARRVVQSLRTESNHDSGRFPARLRSCTSAAQHGSDTPRAGAIGLLANEPSATPRAPRDRRFAAYNHRGGSHHANLWFAPVSGSVGEDSRARACAPVQRRHGVVQVLLHLLALVEDRAVGTVGGESRCASQHMGEVIMHTSCSLGAQDILMKRALACLALRPQPRESVLVLVHEGKLARGRAGERSGNAG